MNFTNKIILITGASRGIGRAAAQAFAQKGGTVAINYRADEVAAQACLDSLSGTRHRTFCADQSNPKAVKQLVQEVVNSYGRIDILINNAGIFEEHRIAEVDYEKWQSAWQKTLGVNLTGVANLCYCAAQVMIAQGGGRIVNVTSRGAYRGEPDFPAYGASKAAVNSLTQSLAKTLAPHHIYVNAIAPGYVATDMAAFVLDGPEGDSIRAQSPTGRVSRPEEIAEAICFLASDAAEMTTGAILDMNGGSYFR